jgi:hypothetical protein
MGTSSSAVVAAAIVEANDASCGKLEKDAKVTNNKL